jgi:preprotein translocase subunit SecD
LLLGYTLPLDKYGIELPKSIQWQDYKLGLDLQGWVELDYKVDLDEVKKEKDYSPKRKNKFLND